MREVNKCQSHFGDFHDKGEIGDSEIGRVLRLGCSARL